jgi:FixJ family two-component response regulator
MFSAHSDAAKECIKAGADDFIAKPFDLNDLFDKINRLLHNKEVYSH